MTKRRTTELKRGAPPPAALERGPGRPKGPIYRNLEQLAETPGEWGQISTHSTKGAAQQMTYHLRRGEGRTPPGTWEVIWGLVNEADPRSKWGVWARLTNESEGDGA